MASSIVKVLEIWFEYPNWNLNLIWTLIQLCSYLDCVSSRLGCKKIAAKFEEQQTLLKLQKVTPFVIRDNELFCLQTKRIKSFSLFFFVLIIRKERNIYFLNNIIFLISNIFSWFLFSSSVDILITVNLNYIGPCCMQIYCDQNVNRWTK